MKKIVSLNLATIFTLMVLSYFAYYLLVSDNFMHISISSILSQAHHLEMKKHLLILGLLPFYIAAVIFGTAILSLYLGSLLQQFLKRLIKENKALSQKKALLERFAITFVREKL
jgi:Na+/citrate or Na+/malate symporter